PVDWSSDWAPLVAGLLGVGFAGLMVHEFAHALTRRLLGGTVLGIELGGRLGRVRFRVGKLPVSVGFGLHGHVSPGPPDLPARRQAAVLVAGPLANMLLAPASLLLPVARPVALFIGLCELSSGLADLVPAATRDGDKTDGGQLLFLPARAR